MKAQRIPNDPRCRDWSRCQHAGVAHGSCRPERWAENGGKSPEWVHALSWVDINDAVADRLPVFTHDGVQIMDEEDLKEFVRNTLNPLMVLIPRNLHEIQEQRTIESILKQ